jgi:hypothetical protein
LIAAAKDVPCHVEHRLCLLQCRCLWMHFGCYLAVLAALLLLLLLLLLLPRTLGRVTAKRGTSPLRVFQSMGLMDAASRQQSEPQQVPVSNNLLHSKQITYCFTANST